MVNSNNSGITIVSACMNRNENLHKSLTSWLLLDVQEIIIVDWSSETPVSETLKGINDPRIKVIRIDSEKYWVLTYAFNIGLQSATFEKIYKLDADIQVSTDFLTVNSFKEGEYIRGFWRDALDVDQADQVYLNGSFGAFKKDLKRIGFYNEYIRTYGYDDSDLYLRLNHEKLSAKYLALGSVIHFEQTQEQRTHHQDTSRTRLFDWHYATDFYIVFNRYLSVLLPKWCAQPLQSYEELSHDAEILKLKRTSSDLPIAHHFIDTSNRYAVIALGIFSSTSDNVV